MTLDEYAESCLSGKSLAAFREATGPERDELRAKALSQWMTDGALAERIVRWAGVRGFVLEPSCGTGAFVQAARAAGADVTSVDIDPRFSPDVVGNFLDLQFTGMFDWVTMNSPFENDMDMLFLEKAVTVAEDVVALIRLNALAGAKRYARVWKHVNVAGLVILSARPSFALVDVPTDSPRHDFCVVHYTLRDVVQKPVEFWQP